MSVREYNIKNKKRNLEIEAKGTVKSTKYFPVFYELDKERIFKPLSKTKPYSTPLFAYSEMYWSNMFHDYIDKNTPVYQIAICKGVSKEQEKYYDKGTIVDNVLKEDERLINLLELFKKIPDKKVNIENYTNYCEMQYDYSDILKSDFFTKNKSLGEQLARQILCSIIRRDDNYHYENVNFIEKNGYIIGIAPMMDMEFSQMFMFPDDMKRHKEKFSMYDEGMEPIFEYNDDETYEQNYYNFKNRLENESIYDALDPYQSCNLRKNIYTITMLYPKMCKKFLKEIQILKKAILNSKIEFDRSYVGTFSSYDWKPTRMLYKEGVKETSKKYMKAVEEAEKHKTRLDPVRFNERLKKEVLWSIDKLTDAIELCFNIQTGKSTVILDYENRTLYDKVNRKTEESIIKAYQKTITKDDKKC